LPLIFRKTSSKWRPFSSDARASAPGFFAISDAKNGSGRLRQNRILSRPMSIHDRPADPQHARQQSGLRPGSRQMSADVDVVIVGAGAAGIAAARRLKTSGLSAAILEATGRVGGRAWTCDVAGLPLDLGCGWLHSADRNPWTRIAEAAGFVVDRGFGAWIR
jgi:hypothetical protein